MQNRPLVLIAACTLALTLAGAGSAASKPRYNQFVDARYGDSIILPTEWYSIPRTVAGIKQEIATLKRAKNTSLAAAYSSILDSSVAVKELPIYAFQAFLWPPFNSLIPTEVDIEVLSGKYVAADLPSYSYAFAHSLSGVTIGAPTHLTLAAGACVSFEGTVANGGGVTTGLQFYLFAHKDRLYILSFELGDSFLRQAKVAAALRSIADDFSFSG
jgi:hypothetical protein